MKIVTIDTMHFYPEHVKRLQSLGEFVYYDTNPKNATEAIQRVQDADIIINFWYDMPASFFANLPKLKMICVGAVGYEWVDMNAARAHKIIVSNCPKHNGEAVAEHAIGLMLAASRFTPQSDTELHKGFWNSTKHKGRELCGKTLGIIGYGFIGQRVGEIAQKGLGMKLLYSNSKSTKRELELLLKNSDVISVNAELNEQTKDMISDNEFKLMKPGVILVNTSRGAIMNQLALLTCLRSGKIFAAGLDVFAEEPAHKNNPLFSFPNVVITPHIGWNTDESEFRLSKMVLDNIQNFIRGTPQNVVS